MNQYGKYGKTRAEEDARRYLREKEELEMEKEPIRQALNTLRSQRSEARHQLKTLTGGRVCVEAPPTGHSTAVSLPRPQEMSCR